MLMTYSVFLAYFHFPVLNGIKYGLLLYRPMQARQVSDKHSLIEQLIWIQFIVSIPATRTISTGKIIARGNYPMENLNVMMESTPHPVGTEFVLMFGCFTKTTNVRNLNFQKGRFLLCFWMD